MYLFVSFFGVIAFCVKPSRPSSFNLYTSSYTYIHPSPHTLTHALLDTKSTFEFHPFVISIYTAALKRLRAADIDQEVKERAITCMGQVVASMGDTLVPKLSECMPIFVDRLRNEITRLTAVRAVTQIAK